MVSMFYIAAALVLLLCELGHLQLLHFSNPTTILLNTSKGNSGRKNLWAGEIRKFLSDSGIGK